MKKIIIAAIFIGASVASFAQDEPKQTGDENNGGFKKENLFTGGSIDLAFSSYATELGASPMIGYSLNNWLDAGIVANFTYMSQKVTDDYGYLTGDKLRQIDYGPGIFLRAYPVPFLFAQAQYEENFITQSYVFGDGEPTQKSSLSVGSLLLGAGYCSGREGKGSLFYYISVSADVTANRFSPYVETNYYGGVTILPVIRAGLQIPLFQGGNNSDRGYRRRRSDY